MPGPTSRPFLKSFAFAAIALTIAITLLYTAYGAPNPDGVGEAVGRLFMTTFFPALIAGYAARKSKTAWSLWKVGGFYIIALMGVIFVLSFNRLKRL